MKIASSNYTFLAFCKIDLAPAHSFLMKNIFIPLFAKISKSLLGRLTHMYVLNKAREKEVWGQHSFH